MEGSVVSVACRVGEEESDVVGTVEESEWMWRWRWEGCERGESRWILSRTRTPSPWETSLRQRCCGGLLLLLRCCSC